jgi:hypothetical protein
MKKFLILIAVPTLFACGSGEKKQTAMEDSLSNANMVIKNELKDKENLLSTKEAAMTEFVRSFNEIQANLNEIKDKEKIISTSSKDKELNKSSKDQIINDIQAIHDLLDKNQQRVASLSKKLKNSNLKIDEIELAMTNLKNQLTDKETEITDLKGKLEKLNVDFATLKERAAGEQLESNIKTEKLNTAYYVVGSKKDLTEKGVVTKKGGFIGIGKVVELNTKLDPNYFTKIDITQTKEIAIHGDKVKLISSHPIESYKLVEGPASIDKIVILDAEKFWSTSKYLIITSEKH